MLRPSPSGVTRETCPTKCHKRCDILHYCFRFPKRMQILSKSRSKNYLPINLLTLILTFPDFSVPGSFSNLPFPYPLPLSWSRPLPSPSHLFQFLHPPPSPFLIGPSLASHLSFFPLFQLFPLSSAANPHFPFSSHCYSSFPQSII